MQLKVTLGEICVYFRTIAAAATITYVFFSLFSTQGAAQEGEMLPSVVARFSTGAEQWEIGVRAGIPNLLPEGPNAIAASTDGKIYVLDTLNSRIFGVEPNGGASSVLAIDEAAYPTDLVALNEALYVLDAVTRRVLIYTEHGGLIDAHLIPPDIQLSGSVLLSVGGPDDIRIQSGGMETRLAGRQRERGVSSTQLSTSTPEGTRESRFGRDADNRGNLEVHALIERRRTLNESLVLEIDASDYLASAELLAVDMQEKLYIVVEELALGEADLNVRTTVRRYSPLGELEAILRVPLASVDFLAGRHLTIGPDGEVYFLQTQAEAVRVLKLGFDDPNPEAMRGKNPFEHSESLPEPSPVHKGFENAVRKSYHEFEALRRSSGITRQKILENAESYLSNEWHFRPGNHTAAGLPSECHPSIGRIWERPGRLEGAINLHVRGVPYKWGGYDSLLSFLSKLERGYLAGDICTCRDDRYGYCITGNSTGVDCSGFVSRTWEESYYTTSSLHEIADPLDDWSALRAGDILNRPGSHVRLVTGISDDGPLLIHTIESAKSCGGVCRATYRVSQLHRYIPMRYEFILE